MPFGPFWPLVWKALNPDCLAFSLGGPSRPPKRSEPLVAQPSTSGSAGQELREDQLGLKPLVMQLKAGLGRFYSLRLRALEVVEGQFSASF